MISFLRGKILEKQAPIVLIETNGIGYEVYMPMTCFYKLPEINEEVAVFIEFIVRKDMLLLFGFNDKNERTIFRELVKISGIGPKLALTILSAISAQQFINMINNKQFELLVKVPGIGLKIASRIMIEIKDQFINKIDDSFINKCINSTSILFPLKKTDAEKEAIAGLISLGYKPQEANTMIHNLKKPEANCETLIREALCATI
ncbi:Holliday junction branch migration protein RuvA [Pantoea sp. Mhis]|uniref:Holliday junction branch migration protein RuvA n=1 Tax=Pantoea sp. Mhis TaxID=2576759 RepID=UPI00135C2117|nr:Holliday junction branch migration protein RuvA [Pantoea sp. Mhis]MXP56179.1 Holliday junction branch migration protein RuvA [Pantoea sp. Mhis]